MGSSKAWLEWHGSTMLRRICGILGRVVDGPVVVVASAGQALPPLGAGIEVVEDSRGGLGPLGGIAAGLKAVEGRAVLAYISSTDVPFLHPAFVKRVLAGLEGVDVCLPHVRCRSQPLAAGYRASLCSTVERMVNEARVNEAARSRGRLRPQVLFDECRVRRLDDSVLLADAGVRTCDPGLDSVVNLNTPDEYASARSRPAPEVVIECSVMGSGRQLPGWAATRLVRVATLGAAAVEVGLRLDHKRVRIALNGGAISPDPETPLVNGDTVSFVTSPAGPGGHS